MPATGGGAVDLAREEEKTNIDEDEILARMMQEDFEREGRDIKDSLVTAAAGVAPFSGNDELLDPTPDVRALMLEYNRRLFEGKLEGIAVSWSKRMKLCAGTCNYQREAGFCEIRMSEPLLKFRPRSDLISTLLHEMVHAYREFSTSSMNEQF